MVPLFLSVKSLVKKWTNLKWCEGKVRGGLAKKRAKYLGREVVCAQYVRASHRQMWGIPFLWEHSTVVSLGNRNVLTHI